MCYILYISWGGNLLFVIVCYVWYFKAYPFSAVPWYLSTHASVILSTPYMDKRTRIHDNIMHYIALHYLGQKRFLRIWSYVWYRDHTDFLFTKSATLSVLMLFSLYVALHLLFLITISSYFQNYDTRNSHFQELLIIWFIISQQLPTSGI